MLHLMGRNPYARVISLLAVAWILLWIIPWPLWLGGLPWLRMGLALMIFVAPGLCASLYLAGNRLPLLAHITGGLAVSVFLVSALGLLGRVAHLPFQHIKLVFAIIGLVILLALGIRLHSGESLYKPERLSRGTLILLALVIAGGIMMSLLDRFADDDFRYLAYVTTWQHAQPLSFQLVFTKDPHLDAARFWMAMFPMDLALLAELSGLHGLLLTGLYLEPFLVSVAILGAFVLYKDLFRTDPQAIGALLVQFVVLLFLFIGPRQQLGKVFFLRMTEDKVFAAFILTLPFFVAVRAFIAAPTVRGALYALAIGLSLTLVHPIILAYAVFIAGVFAFIVTIQERQYKTLGFAVVLLVATIVPSAWLRFAPGGAVPFDAGTAAETLGIGDRVTFIKDTPFYGFNLNTITIQTRRWTQQGNLSQTLLGRCYLWVLVLGFVWSLFRLRRQDTVAPFLLAASLLVLLCAVPYTGWLVGIFVSSRMLWRSAWLLPIGSLGIVLITEGIDFGLRRLPQLDRSQLLRERVSHGFVTIMCLLLTAYYALNFYVPIWQDRGSLDLYRSKLETLSAIGNYLEKNIPTPSVFAAPPGLMDYLPGLSSKAKGVLYYHLHAPTYQPVNSNAIALIFSDDTTVSLNERLAVLRRYDVQYVLIADPALKAFYARRADLFDMREFGIYSIIERRITP